MDELQSSEELIFNEEQVKPILQNVVDEVLNKQPYDEDQVQQWVDTICDKCMKQMADLQKPYKYVVTCQIMQASGAGLHSSVSCYWNQEEDNLVQYFWPNEKKKDRNNCKMYCIITAVGMFL
ncbi:hypothetical protein TrLO_g12765 [Triparma laevis f. longispina]|uniref:Dynein light chain n=1 Tax=Triparma laevis f. longispina TaxID=1714387 RepID=A0A9W7A726_9STRA|nr:hypothetical protein TrLO_g12765 [Triparma laevis f. longispina]